MDFGCLINILYTLSMKDGVYNFFNDRRSDHNPSIDIEFLIIEYIHYCLEEIALSECLNKIL